MCLGRDDRRGLFLTIARAALVGGKSAMADVAATKALTLAEHGRADEGARKLYQAGARTMTDQQGEASAATLQGLDPQRLPKRDLALLAAARSIAKRIRDKTGDPPASAPPQAADDATGEAIRLAEAALSKAQSSSSEGSP